MNTTSRLQMPWWAWGWPLLAWTVLGATLAGLGGNGAVVTLEGLVLVATVFAAVYHAEVVAHRIGEPFGTLVLALAVTAIEVALIVSVMLGGGANSAFLARDTVFAAVMIILNGVVGICLLVGGVRHHEQGFQAQGANTSLAVLAALVTLSLVLPNFTTSAAGPGYSTSQLVFAGSVSLVLYGTFVFVQTIRHRDYFLPNSDSPGADDYLAHAPPSPPASAFLASVVLLLLCLVAVVGLAKGLTPAVSAGVAALGAPNAVVGIVIAAVVLMPETLAALRAARANRLQSSINLALGSALASIGLTIPAVAAVSVLMGAPLALGLDGKEQILLALTVFVSVITLGTGRTTILQGVVHLVIFASFTFLALVP